MRPLPVVPPPRRVLLLLCAALAGCAGPGAAPAAPGTTACEGSGPWIFPSAALRENELWFGKYLHAAEEGSLCAAWGEEAYRFTWLPTWGMPVVVRVERRGTEHRLTAKQLDGAGGYEPGELRVSRTRPLAPAEWLRIVRAVEDTGLWSADTPEADPFISGLDGATWIVEGVREARYRGIERWSPAAREGAEAVRAAGLLFLETSGLLPSDPREVY